MYLARSNPIRTICMAFPIERLTFEDSTARQGRGPYHWLRVGKKNLHRALVQLPPNFDEPHVEAHCACPHTVVGVCTLATRPRGKGTDTDSPKCWQPMAAAVPLLNPWSRAAGPSAGGLPIWGRASERDVSWHMGQLRVGNPSELPDPPMCSLT